MAHHYSGPDFSFPQGDPRVDHCDLFAFPAPGREGRSVVVMDVHPSVGINPPGPTTTEPFAPEAVYELKVDTTGTGSRTSPSGRVSRPQVIRSPRRFAAPKARTQPAWETAATSSSRARLSR